MNYIRHLSAVFEKIDTEPQLSPYHISLYLALFRIWNQNYFKNPISVARDELMRLAKIGSISTYTRSLKDLHRLEFIRYEPSTNRHRASKFYLYTFEHASVIDVVPYINYNINNNIYTQAKKNENSNQDDMKTKKISGYGPGIPPLEEHVKIYFDEKGYPLLEGEKFFNYYESNGWLVGGKSKMKDWKAAARNWILNLQRFNNSASRTKTAQQANKPGNIKVRHDKDFSQPL